MKDVYGIIAMRMKVKMIVWGVCIALTLNRS